MIAYSSPVDSIKNFKDSTLAKIEKNDCVVRAIAAASGWDYDKAHEFVSIEFKREFGNGTYFFNYNMTRLVNENRRLNRKKLHLISNGPMKNGKHNMTVGAFVKIYNKGTYIITISGHAFSMRDGVVIGGNRQDATKLRCVIQGVWKVGSK